MTIRIRCRTLFDITATGVRSHYKESRIPFHDNAGRIIEDQRSWMHSRNQQRNWETLNQLISLRTLPEDISTSVYNKDKQQWEFEFDVVNIESVTLNNSPVGALIVDSNQVPMIVGLNEQPGLSLILQTQGSATNIWFELI